MTLWQYTIRMVKENMITSCTLMIPWYLAIATAWLDDWYFGGDIDHDGDRQIIGGWSLDPG